MLPPNLAFIREGPGRCQPGRWHPTGDFAILLRRMGDELSADQFDTMRQRWLAEREYRILHDRLKKGGA